MKELSSEMYNAIIELVKARKYPSLESFVDVAINNQIILEKSQSSQNNQVVLQPQPFAAIDILEKANSEKIRFVEAILLDSERKSLPIWGLINRFAPAKLVLRILTNCLIESNSQWLPLKEFSETVVQRALVIRSQIQKFERKLSITRGQSMEIGFPTKDPKSQQKFADFYVGKLKGDNIVDGLLGDLELAAIKRSSTANMSNLMIGITNAGIRWANLHSPLVDDLILNHDPITNSLSNDEIHFLLNHLKQIRKGDYYFLDFLYKSIKAGSNTPQLISSEVSTYFKRIGFKTGLMNTYQTGAIARLIEMRAIGIEKHGIYTNYYLQNSASDLEQFSISNKQTIAASNPQNC